MQFTAASAGCLRLISGYKRIAPILNISNGLWSFLVLVNGSYLTYLNTVIIHPLWYQSQMGLGIL